MEKKNVRSSENSKLELFEEVLTVGWAGKSRRSEISMYIKYIHVFNYMSKSETVIRCCSFVTPRNLKKLT